MPNVGTITGSMVLDPSAYISGLNRAAGATNMFQQGVSSISFAGFNRGMIASTTLMYTMGRVMSNMSRGMEEYSTILGKIGSVAEMTSASVSLLAESIRSLSVAQGVGRRDIMGAMYVAAQSNFVAPAEMRTMATSSALLSRASGKEITVKKSADLLSGVRQALGIGEGAIKSNRTNDLLLRSRDIGRWELDQMAEVIGKVATVYGNQFADSLGGEEVLRQLSTIMSVSSLTGLPRHMVSTGTRRLAERTFQLANTKRGEVLRQSLKGIGYRSEDPVMEAFNRGPYSYLQDLNKMTGGNPSELYRLGYQSRELIAITSAMRDKGSQLESAYRELSPENVAGTTERYNERMKGTYGYSRDRLRAQWELTSQEFMQASLPMMGQLVTVLEGLNKVAQSLPSSVKSFMMLMGAVTAFRFAMNLMGFRTAGGGAGGGGAPGGAGFGGRTAIIPNNMFGGMPPVVRAPVSAADAAAARQARRFAAVSGRSAAYTAGFGQGTGQWVGTVGMPWGSSHAPFKPMTLTAATMASGMYGLRDGRYGSGVPMGPRWYNSPRGAPMNFYQAENMRATSAKWDAARAASNARYWAPDGSRLPFTMMGQPPPAQDRQTLMTNTAAMGRRFLPGSLSGSQLLPGYRFGARPVTAAENLVYRRNYDSSLVSRNAAFDRYLKDKTLPQSGGMPWPSPIGKERGAYGPTIEQRVRWAAYKQGQSVGTDAMGGLTGQYGSMTSAAAAYSSRSVPVAPPSAAVWAAMQNRIHQINSDAYSRGGPPGAPSQWQGFRGGLGEIRAGISEGISGMFSRKTGGAPSASFGSVMPAITSFGSAIGSVIGPLVRFGTLLAVAGAVMEGWAYKGRGGEVKDAGRGTWKEGGTGTTFLGTLKHGYNLAGSFLRNGFKYHGDMQEDYANANGYVAGDGDRTLASYFGLNGYRPATANDAMGKLGRENLAPGMVRQLSKGGIDFGNFETAKPYVTRYMTEQLDKNKPQDWDRWFQGDMKGALEVVESAMKFYADVIMKNAKALEARTSGATWMSPWHASVSDMTANALVEGRLLSGRQWDIYSGADPKGKNGGLRWDAGGTDHRGMYHMALNKLDNEYGGFAADSYTGGIRKAIAGQNEMWKGKAAKAPGGHIENRGKPREWWLKGSSGKDRLVPGAAFGGLDTDPAIDMMLAQGDKEYARTRRLRSFMDVMPEIGSMPEADAMGWFTKLTGRDPGSDVFAKTNFQNFRNMDLSQFISTKTDNPTQYAQATQFGSAEAYNELLQRDKPEERMTIAVDKLAVYIDSLMTKQEDVDSEMAKMTKSATKFFDQADSTGFFLNVQDIADSSGGD